MSWTIEMKLKVFRKTPLMFWTMKNIGWNQDWSSILMNERKQHIEIDVDKINSKWACQKMQQRNPNVPWFIWEGRIHWECTTNYVPSNWCTYPGVQRLAETDWLNRRIFSWGPNQRTAMAPTEHPNTSTKWLVIWWGCLPMVPGTHSHIWLPFPRRIGPNINWRPTSNLWLADRS